MYTEEHDNLKQEITIKVPKMILDVNAKEGKLDKKEKKPEISVIIITYNRAEMLREASKSVVLQDTEGEFSYEIVVVDNASTDRTKDVIEEMARHSNVLIRYVLEEGHGIPNARNTGVRESHGEWIAFTDDDQLAEMGWLKELFAVAFKTGAHCVGGNRLLLLPAKSEVPLGRVTRSILGEEIFCEESPVNSRKTLPGTENVLIKRSIFDSIGSFDKSMIRGGSDHDLIRRAWAAGFQVWSAPKAAVFHLIPPYRLKQRYLRWASLRIGSSFAYIDKKQYGYGGMLIRCFARISQALLVNLPFLCMAYFVRSHAKTLDRKCLMWRALGYTQECLYILAPSRFSQDDFLSSLEYRKERQFFNNS